MSWCGGGEIRPTPGVEYRVLAIHGYTLFPGNWPPSPGLAPCAILICRSSALTRYSLVTPNRPLATCLTAERRRSPLASGTKRSASSPPSPVENRRTMADTGSTSSMGIGPRGAARDGPDGPDGPAPGEPAVATSPPD